MKQKNLYAIDLFCGCGGTTCGLEKANIRVKTFEFVRLMKELKPDFILMENVAGMSKGKGRTVFSEALALMETEYACVFDVLNAADYGVPQTRKRLVLHGIRKDLIPIVTKKGWMMWSLQLHACIK